MSQENNHQSKIQPNSQNSPQTSKKDERLPTIEELKTQLALKEQVLQAERREKEAERQRAERESQRAEKAEKRLKKIFKRGLSIEDLGLKGIFFGFLKVLRIKTHQLISVNFSHFRSWLWFGLKKGRILAYLTTFLLILAIFIPSAFLVGQLSKLITQNQVQKQQTQQHFSTGELNLADTAINLSATAVSAHTHTHTAQTKADFEGTIPNDAKGFGYHLTHTSDSYYFNKVTPLREIASTEEGLVGLWHMNGNWNDSKGTNHLSISGTVSLSDTIKKLGSHSGNFTLNGFVYHPDIFDNLGTSNFSIGFWMKVPTLVDWDYMIQKARGGTGAASDFATIGIYSRQDQIWFGIANIDPDTGVTAALNVKYPETILEDNKWHYLAFTRSNNGLTLKIYIDGQEKATITGATAVNINGIGDFRIGGMPTHYMEGYLDEVAIYNRVLSPEEIKQHYEAGSPREATLYRSPRFDLGVKTKATEMIVSRTSPSNTDLKVYARSGNLLTLETDNIDENVLRDTSKEEFEGGTPDTNTEIDATLSFLNGVLPGAGANDWLNQINSKNNITGQNWNIPTPNTAAINIAAGTLYSHHAYTPSVIKDGATYKMWFSGSDGINLRILYATSNDGVSWTVPTPNTAAINIAAGTLYSHYAYSPSVIKDGATYKMWFSGYDGTNIRILYATSNDGVSWTVPTPNTAAINIAAGTLYSHYAFRPSVIKDGATYKMWFTGYDGVNHRILYATSNDGVSWTVPTPNTAAINIAAGTLYSHHAYAPSVIKDGATYKMWFSGFDGTAYRILYATSTDGISWTVPTPNTAAINIAAGTLYSHHAYAPSVIKDGVTYKMWFSGEDGTGARTMYATAVNNYAPSSTYLSSIIDLNSTSSIDLLAIQADLPTTETQISIAVRAGSPATSTCTDGVNWQTGWDSSPVFNLHSDPSGTNPKILTHQPSITQPYRCWQYRIIGKTDGNAT